MQRDEQVNLAFASLQRTLDCGEKVPTCETDPYLHGATDGIWELFSSEVFFSKYLLDEIDNIDFHSWDVNWNLEFHDPSPQA
jgi:hypothetical protein